MSKKRKLTRVYPKNQKQENVEIIEAIKETDDWDKEEMGVSREVFNSIYTSFVNLDKAEPVIRANPDKLKALKEKYGLI